MNVRFIAGSIRFGEGAESWAAPDPFAERTEELLHKCRYGTEPLTQGERYNLASIGDLYRYLATCPAGIAIQKLRAIRKTNGMERP